MPTTPTNNPSPSPLIPPLPVANNSYLSVLSFAAGVTHWSYTPPPGHLSTHLANPAYWPEAVSSNLQPGDWLFAVHTTPDGRRYNILYAISTGPFGIWAQQLLSSIPSITSLER